MEINKIAIIGGSGFVGNSLSKHLISNGIEPKIFDIKADSSIKSEEIFDISDSAAQINFSCFDAIVNLAAEHRDDIYPVSRYDEVNVKGAENLCKAAVRSGVNKIVFTSSVAIYGFAPKNTDESGEVNYFNHYGRTKFLAEQIYKKWQAEDPENRSLIILRPTVIFGEGNRGNVYNLLKQIALKRFVMFGNGKNIKSMAYVENVSAFLGYSLSFKPGLYIYNYVDKPDFDMNTLVSIARNTLFGKNNVGLRLPAFLGILIGYLADFIAKVTGKTLPVSSIRVKKFMGTTQFNSAVNETDFVPHVTLEEGLARTLSYEFLEDNSDRKTYKTE